MPEQPGSAGTALFWRLESRARIYTLQIVRLSSTTNTTYLLNNSIVMSPELLYFGDWSHVHAFIRFRLSDSAVQLTLPIY